MNNYSNIRHASRVKLRCRPTRMATFFKILMCRVKIGDFAESSFYQEKKNDMKRSASFEKATPRTSQKMNRPQKSRNIKIPCFLFIPGMSEDVTVPGDS